mmetsp:Transcript_58765/g.127107  ORF Transcript_58765/g.127107 Transcript_58765/m.127107 type:complete len:144 (-) Transcript_58765:996-1427(-)
MTPMAVKMISGAIGCARYVNTEGRRVNLFGEWRHRTPELYIKRLQAGRQRYFISLGLAFRRTGKTCRLAGARAADPLAFYIIALVATIGMAKDRPPEHILVEHDCRKAKALHEFLVPLNARVTDGRLVPSTAARETTPKLCLH